MPGLSFCGRIRKKEAPQSIVCGVRTDSAPLSAQEEKEDGEKCEERRRQHEGKRTRAESGSCGGADYSKFLGYEYNFGCDCGNEGKVDEAMIAEIVKNVIANMK